MRKPVLLGLLLLTVLSPILLYTDRQLSTFIPSSSSSPNEFIEDVSTFAFGGEIRPLNVLHQKLKTRVVKNNVNPKWNEDLILSILDPNLPVKLAEDVVAASLACMVNSASKSGCESPTTKFQQALASISMRHEIDMITSIVLEG